MYLPPKYGMYNWNTGWIFILPKYVHVHKQNFAYSFKKIIIPHNFIYNLTNEPIKKDHVLK